MSQQIQSYFDGLLDWWCHWMHAAVRWPIHGHYECASCGRRYAVPWHSKTRPAKAELNRSLARGVAAGYLG